MKIRSPSLPLIGLLAVVGALAGSSLTLVPRRDPPRAHSHSAAALAGPVPDFALLDRAGRFHQLSEYDAARAVVLYARAVGCPTAPRDVAVLRALRERFARRDVVFLVLDAGPADDRGSLRNEATRLGIDLPILRDEARLVSDSLGIRRSGEALVVEPKGRTLVYRGVVGGAADDVPGRSGQADPGLARALTEFLDGRPVPPAPPSPDGCAIESAGGTFSGRPVSYVQDVAPILRARCLVCHRHGGVGPWVMDGYQAVRTWSPAIRQALLTRRMPPWHADPAVGRFVGDRSLTVAEQRTLVRWIDDDARRGEGEDPLAGTSGAAGEDWPLGKPDVVLDLPAQPIPARGEIDYRYVRVTVPFERDVWVRAADVRPSNREVMHHALINVEYPGRLASEQPPKDFAFTYFAAYAPGITPAPLPAGTGQFLPAGAVLLFQLHYVATGRESSDHPRLALYLHREPPPREFKVVAAFSADFRIPPRAPEHEVQAAYVFPAPVVLHGFLPHMHLRGRRFRYEAQYPDGRRQVLLNVPRYEFHWQTVYALADPLPLPAGTRIVAIGAYDNSARNPHNPDPSQTVTWGAQSWDEMFIGYLLHSEPRRRP